MGAPIWDLMTTTMGLPKAFLTLFTLPAISTESMIPDEELSMSSR